jgi:prepilin-type N-terminal cleavage/methylation domain-containing protein
VKKKKYNIRNRTRNSKKCFCHTKSIFNFTNHGFTLIEVVVSLAIFSILLFVVSSLLITVFQNPNQEIISMNNIEHAESVTSNFVDELRGAVTGNDGSYPLGLVDDNQIIFYSNHGASGISVKRFRYYLLENILYKGIVIPTGSPLSYDVSSEVVKPVMTVASNGSAPLFYYYDGDYNGMGNALSQPVNINQVRFVTMNLMVKNQMTTQDVSAFPVSAGAAIRNLKDNLGN